MKERRDRQEDMRGAAGAAAHQISQFRLNGLAELRRVRQSASLAQ